MTKNLKEIPMNRAIVRGILFLSMLLSPLYSSAAADLPKDQPVTETPAGSEKEQESITAKSGKTFGYCALPMKGSLEQQGQAFMALLEQIKKQGIRTEGLVPFTILWNDPDNTPVEQLEWEAGVALASDQVVEKPLERSEWAFNLCASMHYEGVFNADTQKNGAKKIKGWIKENGYVMTGPPMMKYPRPPQKDKEGRFFGKIEYLFPIGK